MSSLDSYICLGFPISVCSLSNWTRIEDGQSKIKNRRQKGEKGIERRTYVMWFEQNEFCVRITNQREIQRT